MTKDEILVLARQAAEADCRSHPSFELFKRAYQGFDKSLRAIPQDAFPGPPYLVMSELGKLFTPIPGENSRWGRIFIEIWFCSNFSRALWDELVGTARANAVCAVEHCFDVLARSGADGSAQLAELLDRTKAWAAVEPKLEEIAQLNDWSREWTARLRMSRLAA
jgi:hypothetical protein